MGCKCSSADQCFEGFLSKKSEFNTAFDRFGDQELKCGYGEMGVCCRLCSNGPCRITPDSPKGVCGATADTMVARNLLRAVAAGSACYLHVVESTAFRLRSIADGHSAIALRSEASLAKLAESLGVGGGTVQDQAKGVADVILADLYKPRFETMDLVGKIAIEKRIKAWEKLGLMPGGAKSEVFDGLVKTSTNLNTDPVDQLLHCLRLGICTGLYGLNLTNRLNDVIMGEPEIRVAKTGLSVVDHDYVNIAVTGHSHSKFAGTIALLETEEGQKIGKDVGAKGVRLVGMTCVGQDLQMRAAAAGGESVFVGQAGNNFTQEGLLATGAIDLVASEFNCTLSGIEPIAEKLQVKLVCLDDVAKQSSADLLADQLGEEMETANQLVSLAAEAYKARRDAVTIDIPDHGYDDVVTGVSENSLVDLLGGT
ncbi:MAG: anaerobic carbon-monoxide dehydrogenase catalytic subunit, partial [Planctomycetota bacterium]